MQVSLPGIVFVVALCLGLGERTEAGGKYNGSFADLDKCLEFVANGGNVYKDYYQIETLKNRRNSTEDLVHVQLYILGGKDAHILLTPTPDPAADLPVYEIVLGAGSNTFSEIRRRRKHTPMVTVRRKQVLSVIEVLPVQIRITLAGFIEVTVANEEQPFMRVFDNTLLTVNYIAFSAWGSTEIKFFYDCHFTNNTDDNLELVEIEPTNLERLQASLLTTYDIEVPPDGLEAVEMNLKLVTYSFATKQSTLKLRVKLEMRWTDPKLTWNPDEFNNTQGFFASHEQDFTTWLPTVYVLNGKDEYFMPLPLELDVTVSWNGNVSVKSRFIELETWCTDIGQQNTKRQWPYDQVVCDIVLGMQHPQMRFRPANDWNDINKVNNPSATHSEWHLLSVGITTNASMGVNGADKADLAYHLTLKRNSVLVGRIFCTPLIVVHVLLMASFWCGGGYSRAGLVMISYVIATAMLINLIDYAPNSYVPRLCKFYELTLCLSLVAVVLFVVDRWLDDCAPQWEPHALVAMCLASNGFRLVFGLEDASMFHETHKKPTSPWNEIRAIIDRIAFGLFFVVFSVGLSVGV